MATLVSKFSSGQLATPTGDCFGDVVAQDLFFDITAAQLVLGNIIDLGILPAGHTVTNAILIPADLDTNGTPLVALDVGIMSGTPGDAVSARTCGTELFSADTTARTGGAVSKITQPSAYTILAVGYDRSIGVKIQAAPATAAAGRIRLRLEIHPSDTTLQF